MRKNLKKALVNLTLVCAMAVLAFVVGCKTSQHTENLLVAAGFKMKPATTPEMQEHLKALPSNKVTKVLRDGKTYYVYPDVKQNVLYVGGLPQFQQYQKLREQEIETAEAETSANANVRWAAWGDWYAPDF